MVNVTCLRGGNAGHDRNCEGKAAKVTVKDILLSNPLRSREVIPAVMQEVLGAYTCD
ncbi:hypothetical protein ACSBOB_19760 [Mesorhizobium sp. ASY16-5R]|uniref:hypothetical protein n=1 Tax=Mesorhizobium sp. ASY16-5R TaxID=3445772 RepID=UPI003FA0AA75